MTGWHRGSAYAWRLLVHRCLVGAVLLNALVYAQVDHESHSTTKSKSESTGGNEHGAISGEEGHEGAGEEEEPVDRTKEALVAVITISCLVAVSILFEVFTELLRESADEMNMPFINTIFSELTTLGFIGLVLFIITKLDVLPALSRTYLGEPEKLQEMVEVLHVGLFLFIIIFLVLCVGLLKLGTVVQAEWREFERSSGDIPAVISEYVYATEPPRTWAEKLSLTRYLAARKCKREMIYLALRRRFLDYRSNHPNEETARKLAKDFQRNDDMRFPFNEYLSIISGEVMGRLIEIDLPTWLALEIFLVVTLFMCWAVGEEGELWILLFFGLSFILLNAYVYSLIRKMRRALTPPRMIKDAERLRHKNEWRATHQLPLLAANEKSWILEGAESTSDDFVPPYIDTLPTNCHELTEHELARAQRALLTGHGNGVKLALFSSRLVFLLTAMHLSVFLMRSTGQIHSIYGDDTFTVIILYVLFLLPSLLVTGMSAMIARDGLYAFNVEHMKTTRVIVKVMRILKARQTLRTLRFVAEMKIYLQENVRRKSAIGPPSSSSALPITATLHAASSSFASAAGKKPKSSMSPKQSIQAARRTSAKFSERALSSTPTYSPPTSPTSVYSPPLSPFAAYYSPREKRSDAYKLETERREINTIFCLFDVDGSGSVSREEMSNLLLAITHDLDEAQLNRLMMDLLADQVTQDEISFESFYNWCHQHIQESTHSKEELIEEIFNMVDADGSGYITVDEFIAIFKTLGQSLDHDDVRELVYQMDRNDDGKIDLEEFAKMLQKHEV